MPEMIVHERTGYVSINNRPLYWEYVGQSQREIICLLNGVAISTRLWYPFLPRLQSDYDVLLFGYWGQGNSSGEDEPYFLACFCHGLTKIVDVAGVSKFHLMGSPYGGFVCWASPKTKNPSGEGEHACWRSQSCCHRRC